jgi:hypothetical protein
MRAGIRRRVRERVGEGSLTDTGLAAEQHETPPTALHGSQAIVEEGEFAVPPDEGR